MASILQAMILAGDEFGTPDDFPSNRLDADGGDSVYNAVGGLEIVQGDVTYSGSGVRSLRTGC